MYFFYRGVAAVSISLNNFDLKQCGAKDAPLSYNEITSNKTEPAPKVVKSPSEQDPFYGTDKCDPITTEVKLTAYHKKDEFYLI